MTVTGHLEYDGDYIRKDGPSLVSEQELWQSGYTFVAGVDEAGRGALAGPVVAAAVILSPRTVIDGLNDSKQLSSNHRNRLYRDIMYRSVSVGVGIASSREVDYFNVWGATCLAALRALGRMRVPVQYVLMDGSLPIKGLRISQSTLAKGDAKSSSIAAASIVAKVRRDRIMKYLDHAFPLYRFDIHMGYGTDLHRSLILEHEPCEQHRHTFEPVSQMRLWE